MAVLQTDVAIIGAGPGGYTAAIRLAQLGKRVVIIDKAHVGGVCLHEGCIPTKAFVHAADVYRKMKHAESLGIRVDNLSIDFAKTQQWKQDLVHKLDKGVRFLLNHHHIHLIKAKASFLSDHQLRLEPVYGELEFDTVEFQQCVLAPGLVPRTLPMVPVDHEYILDSTDILNLTTLPQSLLIIGGGYVGVEIGQVFADFGVRVTLLEAQENILGSVDAEFGNLVRKQMQQQQITVYTATTVARTEVRAEQVMCVVTTQNAERTLTADRLLVATGRVPQFDALRLDAAHISTTDKGFIPTNDLLQTSQEHIYAIGDCNGRMQLAHHASFQGTCVAETIAGNHKPLHHVVPYVIYSYPEIAGAGLTEHAAQRANTPYQVKTLRAGVLGKHQIEGAAESMIKVLYSNDYTILGVELAGPGSSNVIGELTVAMQHGLTCVHLADTIHPHPTIVESVGELAELVLGKPVNTL